MCCVLFFFKQKTAYEMRISDWSSDVCSSDLPGRAEVAQCDTRHLELAVDTAGTTGQLTAVPDADPRTVPRHLRQGDGRQEPFFDRNRLVGGHRLQPGTLRRVLGRQLGAPVVLLDRALLRHCVLRSRHLLTGKWQR